MTDTTSVPQRRSEARRIVAAEPPKPTVPLTSLVSLDDVEEDEEARKFEQHVAGIDRLRIERP